MIRRLNHAVLFVRGAIVSSEFYIKMLGFEVSGSMGTTGVFLSTPKSGNDHDLALFGVGAHAAASEAGRRSVGLYHLAWEVDTLAELVEVRDRLAASGALHGATNHGVSRSLYAKDPDGLGFEVMWEVPADVVDPAIDLPGLAPLDLDADIARFGPETTRNR